MELLVIMSAEFKPISFESWRDIYTAYYETKTEPTIWPAEGVLPAIHYMMYLTPMDILSLTDEE